MVTAMPQMGAGQVQPLSAASNCQPLDGDLTIIAANNRPVRSTADLHAALDAIQADNSLYLTVLQLLPNGARRTFKIALGVGTVNNTARSRSTVAAHQSAPQSEAYYEMISGCVNCVIPGVALGGVKVQVLVNQDDSVVPPVERGTFTVTAPAKDTPADRSGLKVDDQIVEINGEPVSNMTLLEAIKRVQGPKGANLTVTMARTVGPEESFTVSLPRW